MLSTSASPHTLIACRAAQSRSGVSQCPRPLELCRADFTTTEAACALPGLQFHLRSFQKEGSLYAGSA